MSGLRARLERTLGDWLPSLSARRRDWVTAALAELPEVPERRALGWALGIAAIAVGDLAEQAFLPWRREKGAHPPARFAAVLGLSFLIVPISFVAALLFWPNFGEGPVIRVLSLVGIALCLWLNLAAVLKAEPLGGLLYAVGVRVLPLNLAALLLAGLLAFLASQSPMF